MKIKILLFSILKITIIISIYKSANLRPGVGYSTDMQQILPKLCYKTTNLTHDKWSGEISLSNSMGYFELENKLKVNISSKGGFGVFSGSAESEYMRSIQEKSYTLSFNFLQKMSEFVSWDIDGIKNDALTDSARSIYENYHDAFGTQCGDYFLASFERGALLVISLNLEFSSNEKKENFRASVEGSYGNLLSASGDIENTAKILNIKGKVSLQALQIGGNPSEIGKIFSKDPSGRYFLVNCDLQNMKNCIDASNGILEYSNNIFPEQIKYDNVNNKLIGNYVTLPHGQENYFSIRNVLLKPSKTLIDSETIEIRKKLSDIILENYYYKDKFNILFNYYPVEWDIKSKTFINLKKIQKKVNKNINILINGDPISGALGAIQCFNSPLECKKIANTLLKKIKPYKITNKDLKYLLPIKNYYIRPLFFLYNNGSKFVFVNRTKYKIEGISISLTPTNYECKFSFMYNYAESAISTDNGLTYKETSIFNFMKQPFIMKADENEFFFEFYSQEDDFKIILI